MPRRMKYGWKPDVPSVHDQRLMLPLMKRIFLPSKVDLRPKMPPVYDQGDLGSCTGNAIAGAIEYERRRRNLSDFVPSRLFIYYNERVIENDVNDDGGAQIRDGIKSVATVGVCTEADWPYDISKFRDKPSAACYLAAKKNLLSMYARVPQTLRSIKSVLASDYAVVFGFSVYESFESDVVARTGVMPMPQRKDTCVGGHAVMMAGYDDVRKAFIVRNSWGADWGDKGYFYMPYDYATNPNLADDFWAVRAVT